METLLISRGNFLIIGHAEGLGRPREQSLSWDFDGLIFGLDFDMVLALSFLTPPGSNDSLFIQILHELLPVKCLKYSGFNFGLGLLVHLLINNLELIQYNLLKFVQRVILLIPIESPDKSEGILLQFFLPNLNSNRNPLNLPLVVLSTNGRPIPVVIDNPDLSGQKPAFNLLANLK